MSGLLANSRKGLLLGVVTAESFAKCSLDKLGHSDDVAPVFFVYNIFVIFYVFLMCFTSNFNVIQHWWHDIQSRFISAMQEHVSKGVLYPVLERRMKEQRKIRQKKE